MMRMPSLRGCPTTSSNALVVMPTVSTTKRIALPRAHAEYPVQFGSGSFGRLRPSVEYLACRIVASWHHHDLPRAPESS